MIEIFSELTPELFAAYQELIPQLSHSLPGVSQEHAAEVLNQPGVYQLVYRQAPGEPIQGLLTLVTFSIPTGKRAWVEDVVVDSAARGHGAGKELVEAALAQAQKVGARTVDLTSRPSREAANRLYRRVGFQPRETNVYRYEA
ncbi:Ribosomal protein S18 acetylase RimI [Actinobaculum suis]|uniref:GNAT family N-acetyltransferase n=1 Tax=Actinobaculum suis TaxID=1657 RepID=A0A0K9EVM4_9ACTO|nr:GNAT family N-acetyltransferase [Actinobaculum suis]KMY23970.1 GNAT family acetyltransferase [Actinobaculum suis]MDY5153428.1 GNAT family N-acetyltransferase [Actinobaculum suis]OCA93395.1 GNAT family acetyltransferase [Actinobaculum suis]OCA94316.1 GNAT family acetyltransferase [Actinobaculum suis]SDE17841.1 Ribosomal protein S18 acetylase RimI [Actinobaculum suis]